MPQRFHGYDGAFMRSRGLLEGLISRHRVRALGRWVFTNPRLGAVRWASSLVPWHRVIRFPPALIVELTNHCNLRCSMCLRELNPQDEYGFMSEEVFDRVLSELRGQRGMRVGLSSNRGESSMHPRFVDYMRRAKEVTDGIVYTQTNGTLITEDVARAMVDLQLDEIEMSVDGTDKESFEAIRIGASYEKVMGNIDRLLRFREEARSLKPRVMIRTVVMKETEAKLDEYVDRWSRVLADHDRIALQSYMSPTTSSPGLALKGLWEAGAAKHKSPPCKEFWRCLMIRWNGDFHFCDTVHDASLGVAANIRERTIRSVWTGPEARRLRVLHLRGRRDEIPSCAECHCSFSFLGNEKDGVMAAEQSASGPAATAV